jgi:hypothetical protein
MKHRWALRIALPLVLILVGVGALNGCLFVSVTPQYESGARVREMVGDAPSDRPVRIGVARDAVLAVLGTPASYESENRLVYTWTEVYGKWVGICYPGWLTSAPSRSRRMRIILKFDDRDMLDSYKIERMAE